ncbi:MAG: caspase family protein [Alphaproteobacteria bacterium]
MIIPQKRPKMAFIALFLFVLTSLLTSSANAERRVALVIGNGNYKSYPLSNPVNDARNIKSALQNLNFEIIYLENANLKEIEDAVEEFNKQLNVGTVGLFYYSGHGAQQNGYNYIIPTEANINNAAKLKYSAFNVSNLLDEMEAIGNGLNIIIIDACRTGFYSGFKSIHEGLAEMSGPKGSLIAFASAPNTPASNNNGEGNSLYTKHLLKHIMVPNLKIQDMFQRVRLGVIDDTSNNNGQVPWENTSITIDFCFAGCDNNILPRSHPISVAPQIKKKVKNNTIKKFSNPNVAIHTKASRTLYPNKIAQPKTSKSTTTILHKTETNGDSEINAQNKRIEAREKEIDAIMPKK